MSQAFNLIHQPWIPVVHLDNGQSEEVGLREALCRAHEFRAVQDPLPTVEFGLYRLLTVLVLDIFQLEDTQMLSELLENGQFNAATVDAYFAQWQDRFDLFSETHPFLQTADLNSAETEPVRNLLHTMFTGQSGRHFHHNRDDFAVSPAIAARFLTTLCAFALDAGRGYSAGLNGTPPWYVLIDGGDLFHTLCLNSYVLPVAGERGVPAWRDSRPVTTERRNSTAFLEALTWRPRRVRLYPGSEGVCSISQKSVSALVRNMTLAPGFMLSEDMKTSRWLDPNAAYRTVKDSRSGLCPEKGKSVWRDTAPLTMLTQRLYGKDEKLTLYERPGVVSQYRELLDDVLPKNKPLSLHLYGLRAKRGQAKVFEWYRETLSLPAPLVLNETYATRIQAEMERAGNIEYALKRAIQKTYKRDGKGNPKAFEDLIVYAQRLFWNDIHSAWTTLLDEAAPLTPADGEAWASYQKKWWGVLREKGKGALNGAIGDLDTDAEALKRQVEAEQYFQTALYIHLATEHEKTAREAAKKSRKAAKERPQGAFAL